MTTETWVISFLTNPFMLRFMAVILLVVSLCVLYAVASFVERVWSQRPRQFENGRELGQSLVPGLRRDMKIWS
jgi:hypothetical protein